MKRFIASLSIIGTLLSVSAPAFAYNIVQEDAKTDTTNRYLSGALDPRLTELGTDKVSGFFSAEKEAIQEHGVQRHCYHTLLATGRDTAGTKCANAK